MPGLGDHDAAVGVADEDDGAVELLEHVVDRGHVAFEGHGGVLDDGYVVAVAAEQVVDRLPAGAVDEAAVDQQDGRVGGHDALLGSGAPWGWGSPDARGGRRGRACVK